MLFRSAAAGGPLGTTRTPRGAPSASTYPTSPSAFGIPTSGRCLGYVPDLLGGFLFPWYFLFFFYWSVDRQSHQGKSTAGITPSSQLIQPCFGRNVPLKWCRGKSGEAGKTWRIKAEPEKRNMAGCKPAVRCCTILAPCGEAWHCILRPPHRYPQDIDGFFSFSFCPSSAIWKDPRCRDYIQ